MMNKKTIKKIEAMRSHFGWDTSDTNEFLLQSMNEELLELKEAVNNKNSQDIKNETADVLMYLIVFCIDNHFDIDEIISDKIDEVMKRVY